MIQSQSPSYSHRPQPFSPYGPDYYLVVTWTWSWWYSHTQ